jgi:regulatory protein
VSRDPGGGEGQGSGKRKPRARAPRPSPSQLSPEEASEQAHSAALRLLSHRERSRLELRSRLARKGFDALTIDQALDRLAEAGLQSDERFAATFTLEAHRNRGLSTNAVQGQLRRRGIDRQLAAEAATEAPEDEEARARDLAERRAARMTGLSPEVRARRLLGYLARRGYPPELCRRLAAEAAHSAAQSAAGGGAGGDPEPGEDRVP